MNLIEKLGGYEKAKVRQQELARMGADPRLLFVGNIIKDIGEIEIALLEYRRQHNIYEEGDLVKTGCWALLMRITKVTPKKVYVDVLNHVVMNFIHRDEFFKDDVSHATNEEIKAGIKLTD